VVENDILDHGVLGSIPYTLTIFTILFFIFFSWRKKEKKTCGLKKIIGADGVSGR
jgi:hypothetical protein